MGFLPQIHNYKYNIVVIWLGKEWTIQNKGDKDEEKNKL